MRPGRLINSGKYLEDRAMVPGYRSPPRTGAGAVGPLLMVYRELSALVASNPNTAFKIEEDGKIKVERPQAVRGSATLRPILGIKTCS